MRRTLLIVLGLVLVVAGLTTAVLLSVRGDGGEASEEPVRVTPPSGSSSIVGFGATTAEPSARLPGITVIGYGEVEVKPDTALIRLTVGSGSAFDSSSGGVALIDEQELEPVVRALTDAGVSKDDVYVNTFTGSSFGSSEGAALITFTWRRPLEVKKILTTAQNAIRKGTDYNLQNVSVSFLREDCGPEEKAMRAALADARERAERLASLSDAKLGRLIAVTEASAGSYLTAFAPQRCGMSTLASGLLEYYAAAAAATADEVTLATTLEVTFTLEQ